MRVVTSKTYFLVFMHFMGNVKNLEFMPMPAETPKTYFFVFMHFMGNLKNLEFDEFKRTLWVILKKACI